MLAKNIRVGDAIYLNKIYIVYSISFKKRRVLVKCHDLLKKKQYIHFTPNEYVNICQKNIEEVALLGMSGKKFIIMHKNKSTSIIHILDKNIRLMATCKYMSEDYAKFVDGSDVMFITSYKMHENVYQRLTFDLMGETYMCQFIY